LEQVIQAYNLRLKVLALLVTASQHRRRGAGSLLVRWGLEVSDTTGLPCYLQASGQGRRLYLNYGFQDIDTVKFNLSDYGLEGVEKMTEMLREPFAMTKPDVADSV
jgi:predicted GNAT family N-acyltransferase